MADQAMMTGVYTADNKINNFWSCENNGTLAVDLKLRLNFTGWVSD